MPPVRVLPLRVFVAFFGYFGLLLTEIRTQHWKRLIWTVAFQAAVIHSILWFKWRLDESKQSILAATVSNNLFGLLLDRLSSTHFWVCLLLKSGCYLALGSRIVMLLDSDLFQGAYRHSNWRASVVPLLAFMGYIVLMEEIYCKDPCSLSGPLRLGNVQRLVGVVYMNSTKYLCWMIIHYCKYGILRCLTDMDPRPGISHRIASVAALMRHFNSYVSPLMIIWMVENAVDAIFIAFGTFLYGPGKMTMLILTQVLIQLYYLYVLRMDFHIERQLQSLIRSARALNRSDHQSGECIWALIQDSMAVHRPDNIQRIRERLREWLDEARLDQLINVYGPFYRVTIFDLLVLDSKFLLQQYVFIFAHFVLVIQTSI